MLDNLEHVIEAPDIALLLDACPHLTILATSRVPLHLDGEQLLPVPPLDLVDGAGRPLEEIEQAGAVALFVQRCQTAVIEDTFDVAYAVGQAMSQDEVIASATDVLAVIEAADSFPITPPLAAHHGLSSRELEVLRLIATGQSNREIAEAIYLSPRTVERHIANGYLKIDVHSRAEATAYALRHSIA